jgi:hypothetical protein
MAEALRWVSRITTVGLMMLLPILGGRKLDEMRGTGYWGSIGLVVGLLLGAWQLRQIVVDSNRALARSRSTTTATPKTTTKRNDESPSKTTENEDPAGPKR